MNVNIATAARLLCSLQAKKVLVLGDVMLDRFVDGAVTRISPEAPVPILRESDKMPVVAFILFSSFLVVPHPYK